MEQPNIINKSTRIIIILFALFWIGVIGIDYINKHPIYDYSFKYFRFWGLLLSVVVAGMFFVLVQRKIILAPLARPITGWLLFVIGIVLSYFVVKDNASLVTIGSTSSDYMHFVGLVMKSSVQLILIALIITSFGRFVLGLINNPIIKPIAMLELAVGLMILTFIMFVMSIAGILNAAALMIVFALMLGTSYKQFFALFKKCFFTKFDLSQYSVIGLGSLVAIYVFLLINFVSIQNPFPSGFDSKNYYMNISMLLAENNGLIKGYAPYNWSFITGIGLVLMDQIELALSIAFGTFILVLISAYGIGVKKLKYDKNLVLLTLAMVCITPALVNQMFVELKVDFGLLFFQMVIVYYLFDLMEQWRAQDNEINLKQFVSRLSPLLILIGILCGFGLGIKMINMFLIFVILALFWWRDVRFIQLAGILLFTFAVFLIAGMDSLSGLQKYHLNLAIIKWGLLLLSLALLAFSWIKSKAQVTRNIVVSAVFLICTGISIGPWVIKNYIETKSLSPSAILMGSKVGPDLNVSKIVRNYDRKQKKSGNESN